MEWKKKKGKNRKEKPSGCRGWERLVPAPSYILGRGAGNLTFFQCSSTPSKNKHTLKKIPNWFPASVWPAHGEGASLYSRAEWSRGWRGWEEHSYLPAERSHPANATRDTRSFPFPASQEALDGMRRDGECTTHAGYAAATPYSSFSPTQVTTHLSVVSWGISLACVNPDAEHRCEMPKANVAIQSFRPRKREGNPSPSLSLLPLVHFNASWNIHFLFLLGCIVHNIWKALSKQLVWGKSNCLDMWWLSRA